LDERKSTSGYVFPLGIAPTSWKSKLQDEVAQSSVEAEYRTMNEAGREANWYRNILGKIGFPYEKPLIIFCDNQNSIKNLQESCSSCKNKTFGRQMSLH
jgi:hypothetical protein